LYQGGLDDTLEDILINNKNVRLIFDFNAFIERAKKVAKPVVLFDVVGVGPLSVVSVLDDMDDMVESLA